MFSSIIDPGKKEIIIVSGLPRSGTSLMMKMLQVAGFELLVDNHRRADQFNPNGYYEFEPVKNLKEGSSDWLKEAKGKVVKIVSPLIHFLPENYHYRVIFMQRNISEVLLSQSKMLDGLQKEHTEEQNRMLEKAYNDHLSKIKTWLDAQPNFDVLYISFNHLFSQAEQSLSKMAIFLKMPFSIPKIKEVIDPNLYRNRYNKHEPAQISVKENSSS